MPKQKFHYYTIRNVLTGEPTLVKAKNQAQASRRFFDLRFSMELTSQEDLLKFARADVKELDVTGDTAANKPRQTTQAGTLSAPPPPTGTSQTLMEGTSSLPGDAGITGSVSPALNT